MSTDCRARCIDGADLGAPPEHADAIAHADPFCPVHGDTESVQRYITALEAVAAAARPVVDPSALSPTLMARLGVLAERLAALSALDES